MSQQIKVRDQVQSYPGTHLCLNTQNSNKNVRINNQTFDTAASIVGMQCKPRAGVAMTSGIYGAEFEPGINSGFVGTSLIGVASRPTLKGTAAGNLSGDVRAYEASVGADTGSVRTIAGTVSCLWCDNNFHGTVTGGVYAIHIPNAAGGNVAWGGVMKLVDNGGTIADLASAVTGNATGVFKVMIGAVAGYVPMYSAYTAA